MRNRYGCALAQFATKGIAIARRPFSFRLCAPLPLPRGEDLGEGLRFVGAVALKNPHLPLSFQMERRPAATNANLFASCRI